MADPVSFALTTVAQIGVNYLFPSHGPRIKNMKVSASTYGAAIPNIFGVCRTAGNVIWSSPIQTKKRRVGKGGSQIDYVYSCSVAVAYCEGPATRIRKMWADGKLIYDQSGESDASQLPNYTVRVYLGTEDQLPDSTIEASVGDGQTPAYRGLCYVVFEDLPLADFGNRLPQFTAEIFKSSGQGVVPDKHLTQPTSISYQSNYHAYDPYRGYVYLGRGGPAGIYRYNLRTGKQEALVQHYNVSGMLGVARRTGDIIIVPEIANNAPIELINPVTLTTRVAYGHSMVQGYTSIFQQDDNWPLASSGTVSTPTSGDEYLYFYNVFGQLFKSSLNYGLFYQAQIAVVEIPLTEAVSYYRSFIMVGSVGTVRPCCVWAVGGWSNGSYETHIDINSDDGSISASIPHPEGSTTDINYGVKAIYWDSTTQGIILLYHTASHQYALKISHDTNEIVWSIRLPDGIHELGVWGQDGELRTGELPLFSVDSTGKATIYILDTYDGTFKPHAAERPILLQYEGDDVSSDTVATDSQGYPYVFVANSSLDNLWDVSSQYYDGIRNQVVVLGGGSYNRLLKIGAAREEVLLSDIVGDLLRYAGLTSAQFDMSDLASETVMGYGWAQDTDVKSILDELRRVYGFDIVESQGKLIGIKRGAHDPAATLIQDVLGSSSEQVRDFWQETRAQDTDIPYQVSLGFLNSEDDYLPSVARSQRLASPIPAMQSTQKLDIQLNLVLSSSEAKSRAQQMLYAQWAERTSHSTRLPWAYLDLDPSDVVTVNLNDGRSYTDRFDSFEVGADYTIQASSFSQDAGTYALQLTSAGGSGSYDLPGVELPTDGLPFIINTPLLRDLDDQGGKQSIWYSGMGHFGASSWQGSAMYKSYNGLDYTFLYGENTEATWGTVTDPLQVPAEGTFALDWKTKVTIWPGSETFELDSISDDELWAGGNPCIIGGEVLQFKDCVENADGSWTIWNLLRGRRGTDYAVSRVQAGTLGIAATSKPVESTLHGTSEYFILLDSSYITRQSESLSYDRSSITYYVSDNPAAATFAQKVTETYYPRDLMPYAPTGITRTWSGDTVTVKWNRRTRFGGELKDSIGDTPLNEGSEKYRVYLLSKDYYGSIKNDSSIGDPPYEWSDGYGDDTQPPYSIYLAVVDTTSPEVTWTAPADFDPNLDTLHVVVYQFSSVVQSGFPGVRSIRPWEDS